MVRGVLGVRGWLNWVFMERRDASSSDSSASEGCCFCSLGSPQDSRVFFALPISTNHFKHEYEKIRIPSNFMRFNFTNASISTMLNGCMCLLQKKKFKLHTSRHGLFLYAYILYTHPNWKNSTDQTYCCPRD